MSYTADQIAALFAQRLPPSGGWISAKQVEWLLRQHAQENRKPRSRSASGTFRDGTEWVAIQSGNANRAGVLKLTRAMSAAEHAAALADAAYAERCRVFNDECLVLMQSGKHDEVRARVREFLAVNHPAENA